MMAMPPGIRIYLAYGHADNQRGFDGLVLMLQEDLAQTPWLGSALHCPWAVGSLVKLLGGIRRGNCPGSSTLFKLPGWPGLALRVFA